MNHVANYNSKRESGTELLKVIAIFMIIIFHTNMSFAYDDNLSQIDYYFKILVQSFGNIGNQIFIISTCWYMVSIKKNPTKKIIYILINLLLVSYIVLIVYLLKGENIASELLLASLLPFSKESNWYISNYVIFLFFSQFIIEYIDTLSRKKHMILSLVIFVFYYIFQFLRIGSYGYNSLLHLIFVFILVSYLKKYKAIKCNDTRINIFVFLISSSIYLILMIYSKNVRILSLDLNCLYDPLILLLCFSVFNIFRNIKIHSPLINTISSLSLFIYIIHENILFREITRPIILKRFAENFFINSNMICIICFSLLLFICTTIISYIYIYIYN